MNERVNDERLAALISYHEAESAGGYCEIGEAEQSLALDLRAARAKLAAWEPVVRAACEWRKEPVPRHDPDLLASQELWLIDAVDRIPKEMRP